MKTEDHAWRALKAHASEQLRQDFADSVVRHAHGPDAATWSALQTHAAGQIRPGFAARVLRAARALPQAVPSLRDQLAFATATAVVCLAAVVYLHSRNTQLENEQNLAAWQQIADEADDLDQTL